MVALRLWLKCLIPECGIQSYGKKYIFWRFGNRNFRVTQCGIGRRKPWADPDHRVGMGQASYFESGARPKGPRAGVGFWGGSVVKVIKGIETRGHCVPPSFIFSLNICLVLILPCRECLPQFSRVLDYLSRQQHAIAVCLAVKVESTQRSGVTPFTAVRRNYCMCRGVAKQKRESDFLFTK